ncbi:S-layer homology domain-containing protein [Brevibacillus invocatus]|uniref:S-layer homology domain-containing protein n=1 Tax=Brevibacillus invocatus TaxID=173959 RepID=UPI00203B1FC1|nr:S-layer homology domain-containing protein [Brevibacillus invocatus]MCM3077485.1 S-layer homology domain-containing protein [Brevibacillus invocatus]MCM3429678.1 S-layer homology domain-containing protein [Brevibacillus invocatus]
MRKQYQDFRRWFALCLTMMMLVTGLVPVMPAFAAIGSNWDAGVTVPTQYLATGSQNGHTYATPIKTKTRLLSDVVLKYGSDAKLNVGIDVVVGSTSVTTTEVIKADRTVKLPDFVLDSSGAVTKVTVKPKVISDAAKDLVELYFQYTPSSTGVTVQFTEPAPAPPPLPGTTTPTGADSSDPIVVSNRILSGLAYTYTDSGSIDKTKPVEVRINGTTLRTLNGTGGTIPDIDLVPGLNAIQIFATNTAASDVIYYEYKTMNSPITITNFTGGTTAYNPVLFGDSKVTLTGTFGSGVSGTGLRLKIITNNGQTVQDLNNTAPSISGSTFTFTDIGLKPGLNQIAFYEKIGNVTKEHFQFYIQYNNTPLVSDLKVNDIPLNDHNVNSNPTYIAVASLNRLTLSMDGTALNADTVEVKNQTTGDVVRTSVNRTGSFGLNFPSQIGENTLEIRVFNQDKEVGTFIRKLLVTTTSDGSADQFYKVKLNGEILVAGQQIAIKGPNPSGNFTIEGSALLKFVNIDGLQQFQSFQIVITDELGNKTPIAIAHGTESNVKGNPQSGFTEYSISKTVSTMQMQKNQKYKISLEYQYLTKGSSTAVDTESGFIKVNNYEYEIKYLYEDEASIVQVINVAAQQVLSPTGSNVIVTSPLELKVMKQKLPATSSNIYVLYNGQLLREGTNYDFVFTPGTSSDFFTITLKKLAQGQGKLTIGYRATPQPTPLPDNPTWDTVVNYTLDIRITPYAQLTYVDTTGQVRSFEDGYLINSDNDIQPLDGKVYNYVLKETTVGSTVTRNISAHLNDTELNISSVNPAKGTFKILKDELKYKKGNNVLKITLKDDPKTVFIYNVSYNTSKTPSVEDIKLEIVTNGEDEELTKKAGDSAYQTGANFLRSFSFNVKDATHVYIEKNGKRINDFRYRNGGWEQDTTNQEYVNARLEATLNNQLEDFYDEHNLDSVSRTRFEGKMNSRQYGDLVEEVQDAVTKPEEQEQKLALFPLTLRKGGTTVYTIVAEDDNGTVIRYDININQKYSSWEVLSPVKAKETDQYVIVNSNSAVIKIFAENADQVLFGKTEAKVSNTTNRDFYYDDDLGKTVPETYYVFTATVPLKKGLNTIKYAVKVGTETYNDEIKIYNANSTVNGAEYRDVLGKKVSFTVFDKQLVLKFPSGTVLLSPDDGRAGQEVKNPNGDIFVDVPLYFGIADRTTGQVSLPDDNLENRLVLDANFNYASPLYYIDAGDMEAPWGRDPYYDEGDAEDFKSRWEDNLVPSRQGTLTLQYNSSIVNAANTMLTIYYHNGDEWRNVGGVVNTGSQTVQVPFQGFGFYMVMKTRESYDDVVSHDFARDAMETLYAKGIMPAYSGSSFGANRDMTRGEFATMLVKALALPIDAGPYRDSNERDPLEPTFTDVRPNRDRWDYEYKYIETAARAGIIRGKQPGYFRPDDSLTREEATIMIARALNLKVGSLDASKLALNKSFTDAKDVSYYAAPSVLAVTKAKLMNGEPNDATAKKPTFSFKPRNNLTRAEMAVITVRVMVQMKKLPKQ